MGHIYTDLLDVYNTYFQKSYSIGVDWQDMGTDNSIKKEDYTTLGIPIRKISDTGVEVYLSVELTDGLTNGNTLTIDCATIRATTKNTIIKTALSERQGTVKRQFNTGDYVFTIKGVLIGKDRKLPDKDISKLIYMAKNQSQIYLNNAYAELFISGENRICIESLEFPEQEGKHIRHRPFVMVCETDFINTLTLK